MRKVITCPVECCLGWSHMPLQALHLQLPDGSCSGLLHLDVARSRVELTVLEGGHAVRCVGVGVHVCVLLRGYAWWLPGGMHV